MKKIPFLSAPLFFGLLIGVLLLSLNACKKSETIYENKVITGNEPPPHLGVSRIQIQNYINRMYIDFIGDEPSSTVLNTSTDFLIANELDSTSRAAVVDGILNDPGHKQRFWDLASARTLNGGSFDQVKDARDEAIAIANFLRMSGDTLNAYIMDEIASRYQNLLDVRDDMDAGSITLSQFFFPFCYNAAFDEINMGSTNFVLAVFEDLLFRSPTVVELTQSVNMVDGGAAELFLQDGNTKPDFLNIVLGNEEFFQGFVIDAYNFLLSRQPTSTEMFELGTALSAGASYKSTYREIAISEDYAGF